MRLDISDCFCFNCPFPVFLMTDAATKGGKLSRSMSRSANKPHTARSDTSGDITVKSDFDAEAVLLEGNWKMILK